MSNKNCDSCNFCNLCDSCNSCDSCYSCDSCNSCESCNSCYSCDLCDSCNSCNSCYSCDSCNSCESCNFCKGLRMSEKMIFCLGDGRWESKGDGYQKHLRVFNQDVSEARYDEVRKILADNEIKITLTKWIEYKELSESEQTTTAKQLGGLLKTFSYEDAWLNFWNGATKKQKNCILDLPEFDADIFKEITGIDCSEKDSVAEEAIKLLESKGYKIVKE